MWKRKEDDSSASTEFSTTGGPVAAGPSTPPRPVETARSESLRSAEVATIGKSVVVKGELSGSEDLVIDGEVEGSICLRGQTLTVGPNGRVRANIEARNVILHGRVDGDILAGERVDLRKSSSLAGNISTSRIAIEDGAFFKGGIDIQKPEPAAPKVEPKPHLPPASASAAAAISSGQGTLLETKKV
jgi:cytoskeletal protein CcmA (bactofilin family)